MKSFFPMDRVEAAALGILIGFSVFSFLPVWREVEFAGMAIFGWLMTILMVLSPSLVLLILLRKRTQP